MESYSDNKTETQQTLTAAQNHLGQDDNVRRIVAYLQEIIDADQDLYKLATTGSAGRLFMNISVTNKKGESKDISTTGVNGIDGLSEQDIKDGKTGKDPIFTDESLLNAFGIQYAKWQPNVTESGINEFGKDFFNLFFDSIEKNPIWQKFWKENTTNLNDEEKVKLKLALANQIIFKIKGVWTQHDKNFTENVVRNDLFTKMANGFTDGGKGVHAAVENKVMMLVNKVIFPNREEFNKSVLDSKTDKKTVPYTGSFVSKIILGTTKTKDISQELAKEINDIKNSEYYKALDEKSRKKILNKMVDSIKEEVINGATKDKHSKIKRIKNVDEVLLAIELGAQEKVQNPMYGKKTSQDTNRRVNFRLQFSEKTKGLPREPSKDDAEIKTSDQKNELLNAKERSNSLYKRVGSEKHFKTKTDTPTTKFERPGKKS